jgi:hypothetical protein
MAFEVKYVHKAKNQRVAFKDWTQSLLFLAAVINSKYKLIYRLTSMFVFLFFSRKSNLIKICLSSKNLTEYKISWSYVNWCKFSSTS